MRTYLVVAAGASLGAILRFGLRNIQLWDSSSNFPADTLFINLTGSFLLAFFLTLTLEVLVISSDTKFFVSTGVLGAFTTFSAFCKEALLLITGGELLSAAFYVSLSLAGGLALAYIGFMLGKIVYGKPAHTKAKPAPAPILLKGESK